MRKAAAFASILILSACAQTTATINSDATPSKLQADTATYFGTSHSNVRVGALEQTLLGTEYKARVGGRMFDCHYIRGTVSCQRG